MVSSKFKLLTISFMTILSANVAAQSRPAEAQPAEAQPAEAQPAEAQPAEAQPAEAQPAEAPPASTPVAAGDPAEALVAAREAAQQAAQTAAEAKEAAQNAEVRTEAEAAVETAKAAATEAEAAAEKAAEAAATLAEAKPETAEEVAAVAAEAAEAAAQASESAAAAQLAVTGEVESAVPTQEDEEAEMAFLEDEEEYEERCGKSCSKMRPQFCSGRVCFEPGLRVRLHYQAIDDDPAVSYVGRNDGFGLSSGRAKLRGTYGDWVSFDLSLEGGYIHQNDTNLVAGSTFAALKDAWVDVHPFEFLQLRAGQFKTPFDLDSQTSTAKLRFAERAIGTRGIAAGQGYQLMGMSPPRNVGVMLGSQGLELGPITLLYLLSATNGNGVNQAFNDNVYPAVHGRLALQLWDFVTLGGGGLFNPRSTGVLPNLYDADDMGFTVDLQSAIFGFFLDASYSYILTNYPTTGAPEDVAMAAHIESGYVLWFGLGAGYRFAWYDPTQTFETDALMEHSIAIRFDMQDVPVALVLDYTITVEEKGRELQNNRLSGLIQLDF